MTVVKQYYKVYNVVGHGRSTAASMYILWLAVMKMIVSQALASPRGLAPSKSRGDRFA